MNDSAGERGFYIFFLVTVLIVSASGQIRECCPAGTYLRNTGRLCSDNESPFNLNCKNGIFTVKENETDLLVMEPGGGYLYIDGEEINQEYCVGYLENERENRIVLVCFPEQNRTDLLSIILYVQMVISIIFLLITIYIYLALPNLRDLQGKCLVCLMSCLTASYGILLVQTVLRDISNSLCYFLAGFMYFCWMGTFVWNNIVTFILWKIIRSGTNATKRKSCGILYALWGFGVPFLMMCILFLLQFTNGIRTFALSNCWFAGTMETWIYFYSPISVVLVLNIFMFLHSIWILRKKYRVLKDTDVVSLKFKCLTYLKLFMIMGIPWIFEVISYSKRSQNKYLWFFTDCLNVSQGVIIFLVLVVCRQKVKAELRKRKLLNINWPESWDKENQQEFSTLSLLDEVELADQKSKLTDESQK